MQIKIAILLLLTGAVISGCGGTNVLPEKELQQMPVKKVMEMGAEKYSFYSYDEAIYYYTEVDKIYTNDTEEYNDARAWAKYEIGFIKYKQSKIDEALRYFNEVLYFKLSNPAPQVLAKEMTEKIKAKKK